jgi:hypothetical protein
VHVVEQVSYETLRDIGRPSFTFGRKGVHGFGSLEGLAAGFLNHEPDDFLRFALIEDLEILLREGPKGVTFIVPDYYRYGHHIDAGFEYRRCILLGYFRGILVDYGRGLGRGRGGLGSRRSGLRRLAGARLGRRLGQYPSGQPQEQGGAGKRHS